MKLSHSIPFFSWIKDYKLPDLSSDLVAGITVWIMLVPQGMAYAMLAGMPPIYGLYGGLIPLFIYGILGTSKQLSVGPVAVSGLLVLAGISQLEEPGTDRYIYLVILTGLLVGFVQAGLGFLRLGFLINFLSHPIIIGFTSAAAVIIGVSQLKYLLGIQIPRFDKLTDTISYAAAHLSEIHWPSFILCVSGIVLILLFKWISRAIPGALIVSILGAIIVMIFNMQEVGVKVVGNVPSGLPAFESPGFVISDMLLVTPTVFIVAIICIVESISIAKVLEAKNRDTKVMPNQELIAMGLSKIGGAFFQSLPTSGSFTRSAVNDDSGAVSGMSSIITAVLIGLTLIFLTPLFYYLPEAALASIILVAIKGLFDVKEAVHLWHTHKQDFLLMITTFVLTLILGIGQGVLVGVVLSLIMIVYRTSKAHVAVLGQLPGSNHFRNIDRFENAIQFDGVRIFRFDAQLFFCNVDYFKSSVMDLISDPEHPVDLFILDASSILDIDSSGLHALDEVIDYLHNAKIKFQMSGVIGPVRDQLFKTGLIDKIGKENHFMYIQDAINAYHHSEAVEDSDFWTANAIQTNITKVKG